MSEPSLYAGAALRRLRRREGLTQAVMAQRLSISPSYLNLIERNQRPVTARVVVELVDQFDYDPRALQEDGAIGGIDGLARRLGDERFADLGIDRAEAIEFLAAAPQAAACSTRAAARSIRNSPLRKMSRARSNDGAITSPIWTRQQKAWPTNFV